MLARRLLPLLAVVGLLVAGCGSSSDDGRTTSTGATKPGSTREIQGTWAGKLTQAGLAPFQVAVLISPDGTGHVAYTGIDCGGDWTLDTGDPPDFVFTEEISEGSGDKCKGSGTVHLAHTDRGTLSYRFQGGGVTSTGFLVPASLHALLSVSRDAGVNLGAGCSTTTTGDAIGTICRAQPAN